MRRRIMRGLYWTMLLYITYLFRLHNVRYLLNKFKDRKSTQKSNRISSKHHSYKRNSNYDYQIKIV